jgi:hypothetical protein
MDAYAIFVIDQLAKERRADLAATSTQHPSSDHPGRFAAIRSTLHGVADRMGHAGHHGSMTDAPITH